MRRTCVVLVLLAGLSSGPVFANSTSNTPSSRTESPWRKPYHFSRPEWFTGAGRIPLWKKILAPLKGKPNLQYLEIGVFEGGSALWVLENILTDPTSKVTCVDIFPGDLEQRFRANLALSGFAEKVTILKGYSQLVLRQLPLESFDLIYIDGSHVAKDALTDAVLSWQLLKPGGILIFDDYEWKPEGDPDLRPHEAIDAFLGAFRRELKILHWGYQVIVTKKVSDAGAPKPAVPPSKPQGGPH